MRVAQKAALLFFLVLLAALSAPPAHAQSARGVRGIPPGQAALINADAARRRTRFIEATDVVVTEVLPDDTKGSPHQKWIFRLANGREIMAVYNLDTGDRIPLRNGDTISIGGEYLWDRGGGIMHWLHADPRQERSDGYVLHNGERYGELDEFDRLSPQARQRLLLEKRQREAREAVERRRGNDRRAR